MHMHTVPLALASVIAGIPGLPPSDTPFPTEQIAATSALITVPLGILMLALARVFWRGKSLGLVAGYKDYGVAQPKKLGRFVGSMLGALGAYQFVFPLTVRWWGPSAFVAFVVVVVGIGVAILIGSAYFERG
jgi:hypothetical protein